MRDLHRMKDKVELSLDGRQLTGLVVVGLGLLGGAFALGQWYGKQQGRDEGPAAPRPDILTALDAKSAADESAQRDASLRFQQELTEKAPARAPEPKPSEPVKVAEAPKAPEPKIDPKVDPRPPEPEKQAQALAQALEHAAVAPKAEPAKLPEPPKPEPKVELAKAEPSKTEPTPTRQGELKDALARAQKVPEASADGQWTLQLSAYQDKAEADHFASGLRDRGYAPFIVDAAVPGKGTWYRVRMGRFPSREAAGRYLADFKRETSLDAFVTNLK
ncbi:MAG: SPOR domain-containing protein [Myxococcaceae bacterium]|nr:SPOR domain-containing protein [Myxococcaceae bacterium]